MYKKNSDYRITLSRFIDLNKQFLKKIVAKGARLFNSLYLNNSWRKPQRISAMVQISF